MQIKTQIDKQGKLQIPVNVRKQLNYNSGDTLILRIIDDELHILSLEKVIKEAQELFRSHKPNDGISEVDEFIKHRREEFVREEQKMNRIFDRDQNE